MLYKFSEYTWSLLITFESRRLYCLLYNCRRIWWRLFPTPKSCKTSTWSWTNTRVSTSRSWSGITGQKSKRRNQNSSWDSSVRWDLVIGVRRGVPERVEDGHRPPTLWASQPSKNQNFATRPLGQVLENFTCPLEISTHPVVFNHNSKKPASLSTIRGGGGYRQTDGMNMYMCLDENTSTSLGLILKTVIAYNG
jgi:hypothetical protein